MNAAAPKSVSIAPGFHASWADVDPAGWRWPHFSPRELACKCGGKYCRGEYFHDADFLDGLEKVRALVAAPMTVTSGHRCERHNDSDQVGGASRSMHKIAVAADISLHGHDPASLARAAVRAGFRGIGFGTSFLHLDMRQHPTAFHYPGGQRAWTARFGRDPVVSLKKGRPL